MKWISTDINPWGLPVAQDAAKAVSLLPLEPRALRTGAYWIDIDSGDELLLLSFADANHWTEVGGYLGGSYQLIRRFTRTDRVESLSHLLEPIGGGRFFTQSEEASQLPERVRQKCIRFVDELINPGHTLTHVTALSRVS